MLMMLCSSFSNSNTRGVTVGMGAGPSGAAGEALGGELGLFRPLLQ
jgi:hypothetical protein